VYRQNSRDRAAVHRGDVRRRFVGRSSSESGLAGARPHGSAAHAFWVMWLGLRSRTVEGTEAMSKMSNHVLI
jgi:hypothetical protein